MGLDGIVSSAFSEVSLFPLPVRLKALTVKIICEGVVTTGSKKDVNAANLICCVRGSYFE